MTHEPRQQHTNYVQAGLFVNFAKTKINSCCILTPINPVRHSILIPWVPQEGVESPPPLPPPMDYLTLFLLYTIKYTCTRTYHAKGKVSWFKIVELAANQKSDPSARNLENSKNLPKFNESS